MSINNESITNMSMVNTSRFVMWQDAPWLEQLGRRLAFGTHAVLYTPAGCARVRQLLRQSPIELQYDDALTFHARETGQLRHFIERHYNLSERLEDGGPAAIVQITGNSTIQVSHCGACDVPARHTEVPGHMTTWREL